MAVVKSRELPPMGTACSRLTAVVGFRDFAAAVRGCVSEPPPHLSQNERRTSFPHHSRDHIGNLQSTLLVAAATASEAVVPVAVVVVVAAAAAVVVVAVVLVVAAAAAAAAVVVVAVAVVAEVR